jgi:MerR family transcriptional regulator, copper efflux regulator
VCSRATRTLPRAVLTSTDTEPKRWSALQGQEENAVRIGKLAGVTGLSRDALRFYEKRGLIRSVRHANGYRDYPEETARLVGYIRTAQSLGFSLSEIGEHLPALWSAQAPGPEVAALLREKIGAIDARIGALTALRTELTARLNVVCPLRAASNV